MKNSKSSERVVHSHSRGIQKSKETEFVKKFTKSYNSQSTTYQKTEYQKLQKEKHIRHNVALQE